MRIDLLSRIAHRLRTILYKPAIAVTPVPGIRALGFDYGCWNLVDDEALRNATVISAGLGEDASFDVEFAAAYAARVVIVDPTPRAVRHFEQIRERLGQGATEPYARDGKQPPAAYDLRKLGPDSLVLIPRALWISSDPVRFYPPKNPAHVSYSITDVQRDRAQDGDYIEVPSITIAGILQQFGVSHLPLIKLDIEGAETEVLTGMLGGGIYPGQILVEYDEIHRPSRANKLKCEACDRVLRQHGYVCVHRKDGTNFTYVRRKAGG
jgi:FkbM family methyltransferase